MAQKKVYDKEFKVQAVKLGREIGYSNAAKELGINVDTLYGWSKAANEGRLDLGRAENRAQAKLIQRLKEENEFLAEASAFFAASRRKSPKI